MREQICCVGPNGGKTTLAQILNPPRITAFVGAGGKTHTMLALAHELAEQGSRVIVTTTTHIMPVSEPLPENLRVVGSLRPDGRLGRMEDVDALAEQCNYLLIEADGSRCHPAKAPAGHEPVLTSGTELVVGVLGLTAIGGAIQAVCHRPELVAALLQKKEQDSLTAQDAAMLLLSQQGQRKDVGKRRYAVVLNQADDVEKRRTAAQIRALLGEIPCVVTAYGEKRYENFNQRGG